MLQHCGAGIEMNDDKAIKSNQVVNQREEIHMHP